MESLWKNTIDSTNKFEVLKKNMETDVCIIGAGIFGLTCSYYLSKLEIKNIVLEKDDIGQKTTGNTTAKITSQHGLFYDYLIKNFGKKYARRLFKGK